MGDEPGGPPGRPARRRPVADGWDVATVVVEFDLDDRRQAADLADLLFEDPAVLTVRVGGPGERSVYRVDVARGHPEARVRAAGPARAAASRLELGARFVRIGITRDGLGDPEGEPPAPGATPWT